MASDPQLAAGWADWKLALVRLFEVIAWPAAFIIVALIFRGSLDKLIAAVARSLGH